MKKLIVKDNEKFQVLDEDGVYLAPLASDDITIRKIILPNQLNKNGEAKIYVEVRTAYIDGKGERRNKYKRISTGVWVNPKNWHKTKEEVISKDQKYYSKNQTINNKYLAIQEYLGVQKEGVYRPAPKSELDVIKRHFPSPDKKKSLTDYFDDYINYRKNNKTPRGTYKEFITVKNRLIKYEGDINKKFFFEDMDFTFSDRFEEWLYEMDYKESTVEKTFTVLKTVLNFYYKRRKKLNIEIEDNFRESEFKRGRKKANPANPLSYNEFLLLFKEKFESDVIEKTKDRFILQCSTGLRYSDIDKIRPSMIDNDRIVISPAKTQSQKDENKIYIDLNKYSKSILEKYKYNTKSLKISNQKYNKNLEEMFSKLNWKRRTSHNGRDTFISICIKERIPIEVILNWTGQSSYSIMRRYIDVGDEFKKGEMQRAFH